MTLGKFHAVEVPVWGEIGVTVGILAAELERAGAAPPTSAADVAERWAIWRREKARRLRRRPRPGRELGGGLRRPRARGARRRRHRRRRRQQHLFASDATSSATRQAVLMSGYLGSIGFALPGGDGRLGRDAGGRSALQRAQGASRSPATAASASTWPSSRRAVKYGMNITHVLLNNGELGKISQGAARRASGRSGRPICTTPTSPHTPSSAAGSASASTRATSSTRRSSGPRPRRSRPGRRPHRPRAGLRSPNEEDPPRRLDRARRSHAGASTRRQRRPRRRPLRRRGLAALRPLPPPRRPARRRIRARRGPDLRRPRLGLPLDDRRQRVQQRGAARRSSPPGSTTGDGARSTRTRSAAWEREHPQPFDRDAYQGMLPGPPRHPGGAPRPDRSGAGGRMASNEVGHHGPVAAMGVARGELPRWDDIQFADRAAGRGCRCSTMCRSARSWSSGRARRGRCGSTSRSSCPT